MENNVSGTVESKSLLPWLSKDLGEVSLRFSPGKDDPQSTPIPFSFVRNNSPLNYLVSAQFINCSGGVIKELHLALQRDEYITLGDGDEGLTNSIIDSFWQKTHQFNFEQSRSGDYISFNGHSLRPFRALSFCRQKDVYLELPCPHCGGLLQDCCDDALLQSHGLPTYSGSLRRFRHCPECLTCKEKVFYVKERQTNDPATVLDCAAMVAALGELVVTGQPSPSFPCVGCEHAAECYGPQQLALSRLVPLSFHDFYLLGFSATPYSAREYLKELARTNQKTTGKLPEETTCAGVPVVSDRLHMLFGEDKRSFLEILLLKIAFLQQVSELVRDAEPCLVHPALVPSLSSLRVDVQERSALLPWLWNFRVKPVGVFPGADLSPAGLPVPPAIGFYSLALIWFNVLLENSIQAHGSIRQKLGELLAAGGQPFLGDLQWSGSLQFCAPENIYDDPGSTTVEEIFFPFWQDALHQGWQLLQAAYQQQTTSWSWDVFEDGISRLYQSIRRELFAEHALGDAALASFSSEQTQQGGSERLKSILLEIRDRWVHQEGGPGQFPDENDLEKTQIMAAPPAETQVAEDDDLQRTVILGGPQPAAVKPPFAEPEPDHDLDRTIVLQPEKPSQSAEIKHSPPEPDDLQKTVVLTAPVRGGTDGLSEQNVSHGTAAAPQEPEEVAKPQKKQGDILPETLILSPEELAKLLGKKKP